MLKSLSPGHLDEVGKYGPTCGEVAAELTMQALPVDMPESERDFDDEYSDLVGKSAHELT